MGKLLRLLLVLIVVGAAGGAIYAFVGKGGGEENGLTLIEAELGDITEKALAVGQIEPRERFQVKSKISGIVARCYVEVGDVVRAGDPLFEIAPDPTPQELLNVDHRVRSADASFGKARADYERGLELHEEGLLSKGDLDALKEAFELAQVSVDQARDNRELTRQGIVSGSVTDVERIIRSTASGTVLSRAVDVGDPVVPLTSYQPGTELASIADMSDLIFEGTVDEIDVGKIAAGLPCRIKVGALPDRGGDGSVGADCAPGPAQRGRDPFRCRNRARSRSGGDAARRVLGQCRCGDPGEDRNRAHSGTVGGVLRRRLRDLCRGPRHRSGS